MSTHTATKEIKMKSKFARFRFLTTSALTAAGVIVSGAALAQDIAPDTTPGFTITNGTGSVDTSTTGLEVINQGSHILEAQAPKINLGSDATLRILGQGKGDIFAGRATSRVGLSQLFGKVEANGIVVFTDPNGFVVGKSFIADVNSLILGTGELSIDELSEGDRFTFFNSDEGAKIEMHEGAQINISEAGLAAFVAPTVKNAGTINAKLGAVEMAAGEKVTLDLYGDGLFEIALDGELADAYLENTGVINAQGGTVQMTALAAKDVADNIINLDGVTNVSSATQIGGKIILSGGDNGVVSVKGKADASGQKGGGEVKITGQNIDVAETADIQLNAGQEGDGGQSLIYADNYAIFRGTLSARGGANIGNGGQSEISAGNAVGYAGLVDLSADNGATGTLLIDPRHLTISNNPLSGVIADFFTGGNANVNVNARSLANTLALSDVNLWATETLSTGSNIDLSIGTVRTGTRYGSFFSGCFFGCPVYEDQITSNNLTVAAPTINILHDVTLGTGQFNIYDLAAGTSVLGFGLINVPTGGIEVDALNLDAKIYKRTKISDAAFATLADNAQINGQAHTVNILSADASINQGMQFADGALSGGATLNVAQDTYNENLVIDRALKLSGNNATIIGNGTDSVVTVLASNVNIDPFTFDAMGADYGVTATGIGAEGLVIDGNTFKNAAKAGIFVAANSASTGEIKNNIFEASATRGVETGTLDGGYTLDITDNTIGADGSEVVNGLVFGEVRNATLNINGGTIDSRGDGISFAKGTYNGADVNITNASVVSDLDEAIDVQQIIRAGSTFDITGGDLVGGKNGVEFGVINGDVKLTNTAITGFGTDKRGLNLLGPIRGSLKIDGGVIAGVGEGIGSNDFQNNQVDGGLVEIKNATVIGQFGNAIEFGNLKNNANVLIENNTITSAFADGIQINGDITDSSLKVIGGSINSDLNAIALVNGIGANSSVDVESVAIKSFAQNGLSVQDTIDAGATLNLKGGSIDALNNAIDLTLVQGTVNVGELGTTTTIKSGQDGIASELVLGFVTGGAVNVVNTNINAGRNGINLRSIDDLNVQNNKITARADAIHVNSYDSANISFNEILGAGDDGIDASFGNNTQIIDNTITNANRDGIHVSNANDAQITGNTIFGRATASVFGGSSSIKGAGRDAIHVENSHSVVIDDNTILGDSAFLKKDGLGAGRHGIYVSGGNTLFFGNGVKITNNNILGEASLLHSTNSVNGDGIHVENNNAGLFGSVTEIADNQVERTGENGISVTSSIGAKIDDNAVTRAGENGIKVVSSFAADIINNRVSITGDDGIDVENSAYVDVNDNTVSLAGDDGIDVRNSIYADVRRNTIAGVSGDGIELTNSFAADIRNNAITFAGDDGIDVLNSAYVDIADNSVGYVGENGIQVENAANADILRNTVNLTGENGIDVRNSIYANIDDNDVTRAGENGIKVVSSFAADIINNRVSITGDDGIDVENSAYVDVNDNTVSLAGDDGIDVRNSIYADVRRNTIAGVSGDGIELTNSFAADIRNNAITFAGDDGIDVLNSAYVDIADNTVLLVAANGIEVENSNNADIENNIVALTGGNGLFVNASDNLNIDNNLVIATLGDGIQVNGGQNANVANNFVFLTGGNGINVNNNTGMVDISDNLVSLAFGDGIKASDNANDMIIADNQVNFVAGDGIDVSGSRNARIDRNTVNVTGENGIKISNDSRGTRARNNTITNTTENGIYIADSRRARANDNTIDNAGNNAIEFDNVNAGRANRNTISNSANNGISIKNSSNNVIVNDNVISNSLISGIEIENVDGITVSQNEINDSGVYGLLASGPTNGDVTLVGNILTDNPTGARFESGNIDISDLINPNIFINTDPLATPVGLQFDEVGAPGSLTITGNTLGATTFDGFTNAGSFYARIENGTLLNTLTGAPIVINGLNASFDGFIPSSVGGILTLSQLVFLESRIFDADDFLQNGRGQIFVGAVPGLNPEDFLRELGLNRFGTSGLNITFRSLPAVDGASLIANIEPAAGGEGNENANNLADIEPAAGGTNEACLGDAIAAISNTGAPVNYSFGGSLEDSIIAAATCQSTL